MPINTEQWGSAAVKGDVSGPVVKTALALASIADALEKIQNGGDISSNLVEIRGKVEDLDLIFDELTGWTSE